MKVLFGLLILLLVVGAIAQAPTGGSVWLYYLVGNNWKWARLDVEQPLQLDTSIQPARLRIVMPTAPAIREIVERFVVSSTDSDPYVKTLINTPISESLEIVVNGLTVEVSYDYTLAGKTVTFTKVGTPGYPNVGDRIQFRYRY